MQSYQTTVFCKSSSISEKITLIKSIFNNYYVKSIKLFPDFIETSLNLNKKTYNIQIYFENQKPTFIFANVNNTNNLENELGKKLNYINLQINNYERLEDILYDIVTTFIDLASNSEPIELDLPKDRNKNIATFTNKVEEYKSSLSKTIVSNKVLSTNSLIEMLGDQLIKIHSNKNYFVELENLQNFTVEMSNFNLINPQNNLKVYATVSLPNDIISIPPKITLISNYIFKNNILNIIEKLKPFSDATKWSIKYSISETIDNIYQMITKYGELESIAKSELDGLLTELEYLLSIKSDNISENKLLLEFDEVLANELAGFIDNKINKPKYWSAGTGYGHTSSSTWNIDEYANMLKVRKNKIVEKLTVLFDSISKLAKLEDYEIIKLKSVFTQFILDDNLDSKIISNIATIIVNYYVQFNDNIFTTTTVKTIKDYLEENDITHPINKVAKDIIILSPHILDEFQKVFNEHKFKYYEGEFNSFHYPKDSIVTLSSNQVSRMKEEFRILKKSIILCKEASIFFCVQINNANKIRFMISGPKSTPYEYGLFIFDMTVPNSFPSSPPLVNFSNNGGKRFNPNLYDTGKVCLSLLGTWRGNKEEAWNINTSTFNQLLISIQSQILVDEPYFNEPGYEKSIGSEHGRQMSLEYNYNIRQYTLDHTINDLLEKNNYPEFQDIIKKYFKFQKDDIIKTLNKWNQEMPSSKTVKFQESYNKFIGLVNKL